MRLDAAFSAKTAALTLLSLCILFAASVSPALAGGSKPSTEYCNKLGYINVRCYDCRSGALIGHIAWKSQYTSYTKGCVHDDNAMKLCSDTFKRDYKNTSIAYEYSDPSVPPIFRTVWSGDHSGCR